MKTLALDLGTKTGWALARDWDMNTIPDYDWGTWDLGKQSPKTPKHVGYRFLTLEILLDTLMPDVIAVEHVRRWASSDAALIYNGLLSSVLKHGHLNQIPIYGFSPTEIKKFATGSGKATKDEMIAEAKKRGFNVKDDNQADAILLGFLAGELLLQPDARDSREIS